jgi:hypothetical protein
MALVIGRAWFFTPDGYAMGSHGRDHAMMHREILRLAAGDPRQVDQINGDGLDNRRSNLRLATRARTWRTPKNARPALPATRESIGIEPQ